jgi:hypothetical protein
MFSWQVVKKRSATHIRFVSNRWVFVFLGYSADFLVSRMRPKILFESVYTVAYV